MTLFELHADLKATNELLLRIATALERISGPEVADDEPGPIRKTESLGRVDITGQKKTVQRGRLRASL